MQGAEKGKSSSVESSAKGKEKDKGSSRDREKEKARRKAASSQKKKKMEAVSSHKIMQTLQAQDKGDEGSAQVTQHFDFLEVGDLKAQADKVEENR